MLQPKQKTLIAIATNTAASFLPIAFKGRMALNGYFSSWMVVIVTTVILIGTATAQFTYPTSTSNTGFRVNDTIVVVWSSSFQNPNLELYGGCREQRKYLWRKSL